MLNWTLHLSSSLWLKQNSISHGMSTRGLEFAPVHCVPSKISERSLSEEQFALKESGPSQLMLRPIYSELEDDGGNSKSTELVEFVALVTSTKSPRSVTRGLEYAFIQSAGSRPSRLRKLVWKNLISSRHSEEFPISQDLVVSFQIFLELNGWPTRKSS